MWKFSPILILILVAVLPGISQAGEISGSIQFTGEVNFLGGNGSSSTATGLSFIQKAVGGSSSAGSTEIVGTEGGFSTFYNQGDDCANFAHGGCGQIVDVASPQLAAGYGPVAGELSFNLDNVTVTFDLTDITSITRSGTGNNSFLDVYGIGTINAPGYDPTRGDFSLSFQGSSAASSFSGSVEFVPEPASIMIFGSALIGLGIIRQRRRSI